MEDYELRRICGEGNYRADSLAYHTGFPGETRGLRRCADSLRMRSRARGDTRAGGPEESTAGVRSGKDSPHSRP